MHRSTSDKGFGFDVDNTIGATPQPNLPWMADWADFWDTHRLEHMLKLTGNCGMNAKDVEALRQKTRELLSHQPAPSLLHGDLWGGNKGFCKRKDDGATVPVIFDPATYYGDREADVAMTYVFGGFTGDFYKGYESEWPLPEVSFPTYMNMHMLCLFVASIHGNIVTHTTLFYLPTIWSTGPRTAQSRLQSVPYHESLCLVRRWVPQPIQGNDSKDYANVAVLCLRIRWINCRSSG